MNIEEEFNYKPTFDLTAAQIGINKWSWKAIPEVNEISAKQIMTEFKFDILPIIEEDGSIKRYYQTLNRNDYRNIKISDIDNTNKIYYRTSFNDLIHRFHNDKKWGYFLEDSQNVLGFVSDVNLNCQIVFNYLYQIISELEVSISNILKSECSNNKELELEIMNVLKKSQGYKSFVKSRKEGKDNSLFEYLYSKDLGDIFKNTIDTLPDKYRVLNTFILKFCEKGTYYDLRNTIMHPVKPIVNNELDISRIDCLLKDCEQIKIIIKENIN